MVTLMERLAVSQRFNKDDCSLKLLLLLKFDTDIKATVFAVVMNLNVVEQIGFIQILVL